jgi:hypothetical protein
MAHNPSGPGHTRTDCPWPVMYWRRVQQKAHQTQGGRPSKLENAPDLEDAQEWNFVLSALRHSRLQAYARLRPSPSRCRRDRSRQHSARQRWTCAVQQHDTDLAPTEQPSGRSGKPTSPSVLPCFSIFMKYFCACVRTCTTDRARA